MAYNEEKLTRLKALKALAQRVNREFATKKQVADLEERVDGLVTAGGEPNKIETVKVNGAALPIADKAVDIEVPTKVSQLTNDAKYQTDAQVKQAITAAISKAGHAAFQKADAVPSLEDAQENVLYLVMNDKTGHYDIYAKVGGEVVLLDDTTVDLTAYETAEQVNAKLAEKVDKEAGKGLSSNDYTDADKAKLAGLEIATDAEVTEMLNGVFAAVQE